MSDQPNANEILEAVKSSGYLMEQEIATLLETLNFRVRTNRAYLDPDESKSREIDVWAINRAFHKDSIKLSIFVELICECKNNSNPFVFLLRNKNAADNLRVPEEYLFPVSSYEKELESEEGNRRYRLHPAFLHLGLDQHHYFYQQEKKAVQFAKIVRERKAWQANHAGVYDSLLYPIAKALQARKTEVKPSGQYRNGDWRHVWLFFPIIVLKSNIYCIDTTVENPEPVIVPQVTFIREFRAKNLQGTYAIDFVTQKGLQEFIQARINQFVRPIVELAERTPQALLNKEVP